MSIYVLMCYTALCTENKCFSTIYYVLVEYENLGIPLSDNGKSMVKKKPEGHALIIKLIIILQYKITMYNVYEVKLYHLIIN